MEANPKTAKQHNAEAGVMESVVTCGSKDFILPPELSAELVGIMRQAREEGKKVGIREVVDWIERNTVLRLTNKGWQAKLEEWGIKEEQ